MKPSTVIGTLAALGLGLSGGAALGGCGTQTKTVSVTSPPQVAQTSAKTNTTQTSTATTSSTSSTPTASAPAQTTTSGGASAPATTRTAPEPAFAETHTEGLPAADALVRAKGYTPVDPSQYRPNQTLQVLVGKRASSPNGLGQQAFFFVDGRFIGTDTKEASAAIKLISQSDTEVTLGYPLYRQGDPPSAPSGGQSVVHYQLNNGKLTPVGKAP